MAVVGERYQRFGQVSKSLRRTHKVELVCGWKGPLHEEIDHEKMLSKVQENMAIR